MKELFENKTILVTGGCGSIGSEIVRQLLNCNPKVVRIFDNCEEGQWRLMNELNTEKIRSLVGDIRDKERLNRAMEDVDIVFHAAALKHVHLCEYNPFEAVSTNVIGAKNLVEAAIANNVERVVGISTDKAVNPINTMGATKLLAEKILTNAPIGNCDVRFCCVRFGNVLLSSGSVIPLFMSQIEKQDHITITHPEMTRFFMSIQDAVRLVLKAAQLTEGGETYILKMNAFKIKDLAEALIDEYAPKVGKSLGSISIKEVGARPGEKYHESLMHSEEAAYMTELEDMFVLHGSLLSHLGKNKPLRRDILSLKPYNTKTAKLLKKGEIVDLLKSQGII